MTTQMRLSRATTNTLQAPNGSYGALFASGAWTVANYDGGFVFGDYTQGTGIRVPEDGLYLIDWSVILDNAASGILGVTIDKSTSVNGLDLVALGGVVQVGASIGEGSATIPLFTDQVLRLYGYGNGSTLNIQDQSVSGSPYNNRACRFNVTRIGDIPAH